jgi:hypothetical protein
MLEKEFQYYLDHQNELVQKYNGRFIVIKDCQVIGDYASELEAINKTKEIHEIGTFLVQKCVPGEESFSATYHSRFAFI